MSKLPARSRPTARATSATAPKKPSRAEKSAANREAVLAAALDEFTANGFAAARLDDVARRAGVAKGTIYLHFKDKEALFEALIRAHLSPVVGVLEGAPALGLPPRVFFGHLVSMLVREIFGTRRKDVLRLVITEGQRFPHLAQTYYREVVSRALPVVRAALREAQRRGEIKSQSLADFPQLLVAPALMWLIWDALFSRFEPLDLERLMQAHLDVLFGEERSS